MKFNKEVANAQEEKYLIDVVEEIYKNDDIRCLPQELEYDMDKLTKILNIIKKNPNKYPRSCEVYKELRNIYIDAYYEETENIEQKLYSTKDRIAFKLKEDIMNDYSEIDHLEVCDLSYDVGKFAKIILAREERRATYFKDKRALKEISRIKEHLTDIYSQYEASRHQIALEKI